MINEIGEIAGKVWQYPSQHPEAAPRDINKTLGSGDPLLFMAIGCWLAREAKVVLKRNGRGVKMPLATQYRHYSRVAFTGGEVGERTMACLNISQEYTEVKMNRLSVLSAIAFVGLLTLLGAPTVAAAHTHKTKVGNWGYLTFKNETRVGTLTLPPGSYLFEHFKKGTNHFARFSRITWGVTSHYRLAGEVKCRLEPLPAKVKRTTVQLIREDGVDRVTRIEVRGENVAHLF